MKTMTLKENWKIEELPICLPVEVLNELNEIALENNMEIQTLMLDYILEGIVKAQSKHKKNNFIKHTQEIMEQHNVLPLNKEVIAEKFTYKYL